MKKKLLEKIILKCSTNTFDPLHLYSNKQNSANWIQNISGIPYLKLNLDIPVNIISEEIKNIQHLFVPHRTEYNEHTGWHSFCIHGKSYNSTREDEYYNDNRPYTWTNEASTLMPNTVNFFKEQWFGNSFSRLRVMKLDPGGYVFLHNDYTEKKLSPVNIAITQPNGCDFVFEEFGIVPFLAGNAFLLDVSNKHCVYNNSNETRYHIIAHHLTTTENYNKIIEESYKKYINEISTPNN